jgi:membrane protein implicated in regulation of membrane protease activity
MMSKVLVFLIAALIIIVLLAALQIFLSMSKNKYLGLILPAINLLVAAFMSFGNMIYTGDIAPILAAFALFLIPAVINLAIYKACREKVKEKNKQEINKMNIQDLE